MIEVAPTCPECPDPYFRAADLSDEQLRDIIIKADAVLESHCWWGAEFNAQVSRRQALAELTSRGKQSDNTV